LEVCADSVTYIHPLTINDIRVHIDIHSGDAVQANHLQEEVDILGLEGHERHISVVPTYNWMMTKHVYVSRTNAAICRDSCYMPAARRIVSQHLR
jgi:hypothetical protein